MQVQEIMTRNVYIVDPEMTIRDAARRMRTDNIGALPVGENDRLIGMVTDPPRPECLAGLSAEPLRRSHHLGIATARDVAEMGCAKVWSWRNLRGGRRECQSRSTSKTFHG
jgi:CBS-domain-containing membrane protein